jgi:hypothetical protein
LNCNALIAAVASLIFSSRRPFGESVVNDRTLPLASTVMVKTTSFVPASRNAGAAALHIACGGIAFSQFGCPPCAGVGMKQKNKTTGRITLFIDSLYAVMADGFYS